MRIEVESIELAQRIPVRTKISFTGNDVHLGMAK